MINIDRVEALLQSGMSRRQLALAMSTPLLASCARAAGAFESPPDNAPLIKVNQAPTDQEFIPLASGDGQAWSFYFTLVRPSVPLTTFSDYGLGINSLVLNGPRPDVGFDGKFFAKYQDQLKQGGARSAIWFNNLAADTLISVIDERNITKAAVSAQSDGFAGLLLPDNVDYSLRVRIIRAAGNFQPVTAAFSQLSQTDAGKILPSTVVDLAKALGLPANMYPTIRENPVPAERQRNFPQYKFDQVSADPKLQWQQFYGLDANGSQFNHGLLFRMPTLIKGSSFSSVSGPGQFAVKAQVGTYGFDMDWDINPDQIGNYMLDASGNPDPNAETPAAFLQHIQPGSSVYLLDPNRNLTWPDGRIVKAVTDAGGSAMITIPSTLAEMRMRVVFANPTTLDPNASPSALVGFGAKPKSYNPPAANMIDGSKGLVSVDPNTFKWGRNYLPLSTGGAIYQPR